MEYCLYLFVQTLSYQDVLAVAQIVVASLWRGTE